MAITQSSGRERLNIHGAIDLETGNTRMLDVLVVNAASTIMLLMAIEAMYPGKRLIHVFLDNARYHHAKLVQQWLARSGCRFRLHFIPSYCPHLDPIERLWGLMHRHCTHNKCYAGFKDFTRVVLTFLREKVPRNWHVYCDQVTDNFRVCSATIRMEAVLPHLGMLPSGSSIASPGCSRRHVSLSIDYTGSAAPHGVTQTGFPVRSTSLLSRPDLAPPKSRRAAEGIGRSGATRSHAQRAVAREHGEDGEHRTFPEVSTVAHSRRSRIGRLRIHCEA